MSSERRYTHLSNKNLSDVAKQLTLHFQAADKDKDGNLTRAELIHYMRQSPDLKLLLGFNPYKGIGDAERRAFEAVYQQMDSDSDGYITEAELVAYFTTFPLGTLLEKIGCAERFIARSVKTFLDEGFETEDDLAEMFAAHTKQTFNTRLVDAWKLPEQIATKLCTHFAPSFTKKRKVMD